MPFFRFKLNPAETRFTAKALRNMALFISSFGLCNLQALAKGATSASASQAKIGPQSAVQFHELKRLNIGGDGGWDYLTVDAAARRLYIARTNRVLVIDSDSGTVIGEVTGLDGAHGIALVKEQQRGFATSGKTGEVIAFDLKTLKTIAKIKAGAHPDAIIYDPFSKRIFAFNGKSHDVTAIDPLDLTAIGTLPLGGKPEFASSDAAGHVFVNIEDTSELATLDSKNLKVLARHSLKPCEEPTGLSIDAQSSRLLVGCGNQLSLVVEAGSGKILQTFKVGDGVDATAFDATRKLGFISAGEGLLSVLKEEENGFHSAQEVPTIKGARTLAVDEKTGHVFLPFAKFAPVDPASGSTNGGHTRPPMIPGTFGVLVIGADR